MATSLLTLRTYCQRHGWLGRTSADTTQLDQWINDVLQFLALARKWNFYETQAAFNLTAPYATGTATTTLGSATVTGVSPADFAAGMVGQEFAAANDTTHVYTITAVSDSNNTLTIDPVFLGATATQAYTVNYIRYTAPTDFGQPGPFYFEDGREISSSPLSVPEYMTERMMNRSTASAPSKLSAAMVGSAWYFFTHPAPSASAMVKYVYWKKPNSLSGDSDETTWPDQLRGLLFDALRVRVATDDTNVGMTQLESLEFQSRIDAAYQSLQTKGPISIHLGGASGDRIPLNGLSSIVNVTD